jgi:hypothetical protein
MKADTLDGHPYRILPEYILLRSPWKGGGEGAGTVVGMTLPSGSCHCGQGSHADQVVYGRGNREHPADQCHAAVPGLPQ